MNGRRPWYLWVIGAAAALALGLGIFSFVTRAPMPTQFSVTGSLPTAAAPASPNQVQPTPKPQLAANFCPGGKLGPIIYYANDPIARPYHAFGSPLSPGENPLEALYSDHPTAKVVVSEFKTRLCHDPQLARATVAAAYPNWPGLHGPFNWAAALHQLSLGDWAHARMAWSPAAPSPWTLEMVSHKRGPPSIYIVPPPLGGWYLNVRFGGSDEGYRTECGGQPVLYINGRHASLKGIFPSQ